jgi:trk system potassium uptake protein TrkA
MTTLLKIRRGEFSLVEEKLPEGAKAIGVSLRDLPLPPSCVIAAVIRGGKVLTPRGDMTFQADDEVLAVVDNKSLPALKELFNTEKEL